MSGKMLSIKRRHDCRTPRSKEMRGVEEAEWQCECGQVWDWMRTYAGDGWSRRPEWVDYWRNR